MCEEEDDAIERILSSKGDDVRPSDWGWVIISALKTLIINQATLISRTDAMESELESKGFGDK